MLEIMKQMFPERIETNIDLNKRAGEKGKSILYDLIKKYTDKKEGSMIGGVALVSHSRFLLSFIADKFNENYYPIEVDWFENCEVREYPIEFFSKKI